MRLTSIACRTIAMMALVGMPSLAAMANDASYPEARFPSEVFKGLQGPLVIYDPNGGKLAEALDQTIHKHFSDLTGVTVQNDFNGDSVKFFAAMESQAPVPWSVIGFTNQGDLIRARDAGFLAKIDAAKVPLADLEQGSYDEYGFAAMRYGINLVYNTTKWPDKASAPDNLTDLLDTARFPGKRCLFKYPQYGGVLEAALLADGVEADDLYPIDLDRALKKLDTIKSDIVWWGSGDESIQLLTTGECDIGVIWNGRAFSAVTNDKAPLSIVWKNALYTSAFLAIPSNASNLDAANAYLAMWIRDLDGQRGFVGKMVYTTPIMRLDEEGYAPELQQWLLAGENASGAIKEDGAYYAEHLPVLLERFNQWVAASN